MIRPGSVKICSLREVEHARHVLDAGADLFGLIFVPGVRRQVSIDRAREIVDAVRSGGKQPPLAVGVFVDASALEINRTVHAVGLDLVQLHGDEPPDLMAHLDAPAIKVMRPMPGMASDDVRAGIDRYARAAGAPLAFHLEGFDAAHHGGEGARADWRLASELAQAFPVILAGGLTPDNVAEAVEMVRPFAVDVSSGVETGGIKDERKIASFVASAKRGFARLAASG